MATKPGELFYLMGPSGSGKDTLIRCARARIPPEAPIAFAHRYITRPVELDRENHIAVTEIEFERLIRYNCCAMRWETNGLSYGIGTEIHNWLDNGLNVVVNGSREYFSEAARVRPRLFPVLIQAPEALLRERLVQRGRESPDEVEQRLARSRKLSGPIHHPQLMVINNAGTVEEASGKLIRFIMSHLSVP